MNRIYWILVLWLILALSTFLQLLVVEYSGHQDYRIIDYVITPLASMLTGIFLFFAMILPVFDTTARMSAGKRISVLAIAGLVYSVVFILILHLFPIVFSDQPSDYRKSVFGFFAASFHNVVKNYLFQVAILYAFEYISKETGLIRKQKNLEIELNQTKLQLLKSQLQPHFLFNALNSVVSEIDVNGKNAQQMLINLGDILRTTLDSDFQTPVALRDELSVIEKYLSIEKIRYEEQLDYKIICPEGWGELQVPGMILQPVIENAIKHGFKGLNKAIELMIIIDPERKMIEVRNNGTPLDPGYIMRTGLSNVKERMKIFTGRDDAFQICQEGDWVVNRILLQ